MRDRDYFTSRWSWTVKPFNDWYHIMAHTYGTWLPGDPKGFRARHHRQHVDGDYRNPPPKGKYDALHRYARSLMKRDPVILTAVQKQRVLEELIASLHKRNIEVIVLVVSKIHIHVLARFPDHNPRKWIGIAKKNHRIISSRKISHRWADSGPHGASASPSTIVAIRSKQRITSSSTQEKGRRCGGWKVFVKNRALNS